MAGGAGGAQRSRGGGALRDWPGREAAGEVGLGLRFIAAPGAGRAGPAGPLFCLVLLFKQSPLFRFLSKVHFSSWGLVSCRTALLAHRGCGVSFSETFKNHRDAILRSALWDDPA